MVQDLSYGKGFAREHVKESGLGLWHERNPTYTEELIAGGDMLLFAISPVAKLTSCSKPRNKFLA